MRLTGKLVGVEDLVKKVTALGKSAAGKIARKAQTKGAQIASRKAKALAPDRTGTYRKAIGYKVRTTEKGVTLAIIGAREDIVGSYLGKPVKPWKYDHLAEGGRKAVRAINKRVLSEGKGGRVFGPEVRAAQGKHFLAATQNATRAQVQAEVARVLGEEVTKAARGTGDAGGE